MTIFTETRKTTIFTVPGPQNCNKTLFKDPKSTVQIAIFGKLINSERQFSHYFQNDNF